MTEYVTNPSGRKQDPGSGRFKHIEDVCGQRTFTNEILCQDQLKYQPCKSSSPIYSQGNKSLIEDFNVSELFEQITLGEDDLNSIDEAYTTLFIAEDKLQKCPKVKFTNGNEEIISILDTGSELCLLSQDLHNKLRDNRMRNLDLPVQDMNLVSSFSDKARKVKTQAMLTLKFREVRVDHIFLIAPGLLTKVLLGAEFCVANNVTISFPDKCFTINIDSQVTKHTFLQETDYLINSLPNSTSDHPSLSDVRLTSVLFLNSTETQGLTDEHAINFPHKETQSEVTSVRDSLALTSSRVRSITSSYCCTPPRQDACEVINNSLTEYEKTWNGLHKKNNANFLECNGHK
jgi:hypothetical protein